MLILCTILIKLVLTRRFQTSQRHNRLCHFISDIMDYFLAGEDQRQNNQPNDLAGGKPINL